MLYLYWLMKQWDFKLQRTWWCLETLKGMEVEYWLWSLTHWNIEKEIWNFYKIEINADWLSTQKENVSGKFDSASQMYLKNWNNIEFATSPSILAEEKSSHIQTVNICLILSLTPCTFQFVVYWLNIHQSDSFLHFKPLPCSCVCFFQLFVLWTGKDTSFIHQIRHKVCTTCNKTSLVWFLLVDMRITHKACQSIIDLFLSRKFHWKQWKCMFSSNKRAILPMFPY